MKNSICSINCEECPSKAVCPGCIETGGCPFGKQCFLAKYILTGGMDNYIAFKNGIIDEINALKIDGMEQVSEVVPLVGRFVNLEYPLPNGSRVKLLCDDEIYLGTQVKNLLDDSGKSCFGVVARENFLVVTSYDEGCQNPELVVFKRR